MLQASEKKMTWGESVHTGEAELRTGRRALKTLLGDTETLIVLVH